MADNETRVFYKAIADFSAVASAARRAKREIRDLRQEEAKLNAQSAASSAAVTTAAGRNTKATNSNASALQGFTRVVNNHTAAVQRGNTAQKTLHATTTRTNTVMGGAASAFNRAATGAHNAAAGANNAARGFNNGNNSGNRFTRTLQGMFPYIERVNNGLDRLGKWRPRLTPPFIALIPIIAGVLALINPLVAGFGAIGGAAIGFASSLGQVAGAALGAIPALFSLLSVVAAMKTAFSGVGGAFSAFKAMKTSKAGAGGSAAPQQAELTRTERIRRAQESYRRAIQDVKFAQDDLNEARKGYIKRLKELQRAVDDAGLSEMRAAANAQLAYEDYRRTLADPNASQGDRMAAEVAYKEALEEQTKVQEENKQNAADLAEMKKKGMSGDREVIMAQRALTDAVNRQRDAQLELINAKRGTSKAATGTARATNLYNDALKKLSPSARKVVEGLIAMSDEWAKVRRTVQESFFSKIVNDMGRLRSLLPTVRSLLSNTAGAMGDVAHNFLVMVSSPEWKKDLVLLGEGNVPIIRNIGDGILTLMDSLRDLTVIAQPFFEALTVGFKEGAKNLREMIGDARKSGSLSKWLMGEKEDGNGGVLATLKQWWRIIKNIGKTLFNFSSAASEFAGWITDGLEAATQGWLKSSEDATKKDSPFKKWLENIKPLLSEISRMFGTFFKWFAEESSDPKNIEQMAKIFKLITDKLGPSLATLFDSLSKAEIGPKFIDSIVKLVDIIVSLSDSEAVKVFFDVLNRLLDFVKQVLDMPGIGDALKGMAAGFAAIAAISFVAKFTGLENFVGWILKLRNAGTVANILKRIRAAFAGNWGTAFGPKSGLPGAGGPAGGAAGGGTTPVGAAGGSSKGKRTKGTARPKAVPASGQAPAGGGTTVVSSPSGRTKGTARPKAVPGSPRYSTGTYAPVSGAASRAATKPGLLGRVGSKLGGKFSGLLGLGATLGPQAGGLLGKTGGFLGKAGGLLGKGVKGLLGGGIGSLIGTIVGETIAGTAAEGKAGATQRVGGSVLSGAASGAGLGAMLGSIFPGLGTAIGAGVGGVVGGVGSYMGASDEDKAAMWEQVGKWFEDTASTISDWWTNTVVPAFTGVSNTIGTWWNDLVVTPFTNTANTISTWWNEQVVTPFVNTATSISTWWNEQVVIPFQELSATIGRIWNLYVVTPFKIAGSAIKTWWNDRVVIPFSTAANNVKTWWNDKVVAPFATAANNVKTWWNDKVVSPFQTAANNIKTWWNDHVISPFKGTISGIQRGWDGFWEKIRGFNPIRALNDWLWSNVPGAAQRHNGGPIKRAGGGTVPGHGNSDKVPASLTPGEFVLRKAVVTRIGEGNLVKLNAGILSYTDLLRQAALAARKPKEDAPNLFFNGGGLVPNISGISGPSFSQASLDRLKSVSTIGAGSSRSGSGRVVVVENLTINNPKPETARESLHQTVRKLNYLYGGSDV